MSVNHGLLSHANISSSVLSKRLATSPWLSRKDNRAQLAGASSDASATDFGVGLDDPGKTWRVGAAVSLNLFNGLQTHIQRQNAQISLSSEKVLEAQARLDLEREVTNVHESYLNSRTVLALEEENLTAAELNFSRTEELYQLGQVTNTQFREAQINLIRAKSNISEAKYDAKLNEIHLLRISGRLIRGGGE